MLPHSYVYTKQFTIPFSNTLNKSKLPETIDLINDTNHNNVNHTLLDTMADSISDNNQSTFSIDEDYSTQSSEDNDSNYFKSVFTYTNISKSSVKQMWPTKSRE